MRGPGVTPSSMARFKPQAGPARSRTLVKPRISVSLAAPAATMLMNPGCADNPSFSGIAAIMECQCASIRPGISVRPPPSITVAVEDAAASPIAAMLLPLTSTLDGAVNRAVLPSKTRTLRKRTSAGAALASTATGAAGA